MEIKPEDFTREQLEAGRKLLSGSCNFMLGVARLDQLPVSSLDEIAFAGRSNVGKSSLINAADRTEKSGQSFKHPWPDTTAKLL